MLFLNKFKEISGLMDEQLKIHNKILELETQKTGVLVKGDIDALNYIVNMQQPYIMSSSNFEKRREKLQKEMGLSGLSLNQIISEYPEAKFLEKNFSEMSKVLIELKKACARNRKILNSRLDVVNYVLSKTGASNEMVTYSNTKKSQNINKGAHY